MATAAPPPLWKNNNLLKIIQIRIEDAFFSSSRVNNLVNLKDKHGHHFLICILTDGMHMSAFTSAKILNVLLIIIENIKYINRT